MVNLIGTLHIKKLLHTWEDNILKIFLNFITQKQWNDFSDCDTEIEIPKKSIIKPKKVKDVLKYLTKACELLTLSEPEIFEGDIYRKFDCSEILHDSNVNQNQMVTILYITMEAFLDAYSLQFVQDAIDNLNEKLLARGYSTCESTIPEQCSYSVTEDFIKQYRTIFQVSTELVSKLSQMKESKKLPLCVLKISNALGFIQS